MAAAHARTGRVTQRCSSVVFHVTGLFPDSRNLFLYFQVVVGSLARSNDLRGYRRTRDSRDTHCTGKYTHVTVIPRKYVIFLFTGNVSRRHYSSLHCFALSRNSRSPLDIIFPFAFILRRDTILLAIALRRVCHKMSVRPRSLSESLSPNELPMALATRFYTVGLHHWPAGQSRRDAAQSRRFGTLRGPRSSVRLGVVRCFALDRASSGHSSWSAL